MRAPGKTSEGEKAQEQVAGPPSSACMKSGPEEEVKETTAACTATELKCESQTLLPVHVLERENVEPSSVSQKEESRHVASQKKNDVSEFESIGRDCERERERGRRKALRVEEAIIGETIAIGKKKRTIANVRMTEEHVRLEKREHPLSIPVVVDELLVHGFLDTGAGVSVLSLACFSSLRSGVLQDYQGPVLEGADGRALTVHGVCEAHLQLKKQIITHRLVVVEGLVFDLLLGRDIMARLGQLKVDFGTGDITLGDQHFQGTVDTERFEGAPVRQVRWARDIIIPPRSGTFTAHLAIEGSRDLGELGIFVPNPWKTAVVAPVLLALGRSGLGVARVCNPSKKPLHIRKGAVAGVFESLEGVHGVRVCTLSGDLPAEPTAQQPMLQRPTLEELGINLGTDVVKEGPACVAAARALMEKWRSCFDDGKGAVPNEDLPVTHEVETGESRPIKSRIYRVSPAEAEAQLAEITAMLTRGVIEPCESQWGFPVVMVNKKDGTYRFCVDYRALNAVTKKDIYPLPRIDDCLDQLAGMKWFTVLDAKSGYWQMRVNPADRDKTAFISKFGLYRFVGMPFGLTNAPASFQRLMDALLAGLTWQECLVFIDDILIFAPTFEELVKRMDHVFERLDGKIKLGGKKCQVFCRRLGYLGHNISEQGVEPQPQIIEAVKNFEQPLTVKGVRSFIGLCNFYRRFVKDFSKIAKPLHDLTKGHTQSSNEKISWTNECETAFCALKNALTSAPILAWPDFSKPFVLYTDGSVDGLGAILGQEHATGSKVIAYFSQLTNNAESRYSATELECLAVVRATKEFSHYLRGSRFRLVTDHWALKWLHNLKEPTGRLGRWQLRMMELEYDVEYREGVNNHVDALSRPIDPAEARRRRAEAQEKHVLTLVTAISGGATALGAKLAAVSPKEPETAASSLREESSLIRWKEAQRRCDKLSQYFDYMEKGELPSDTSRARVIVGEAAHMIIDKGILRFLNTRKGNMREQCVIRIAVPQSLRAEVLAECHDHPMSGHFGVERTYFRVCQNYWWLGMYSDVKKYVLSCPICARDKPSQVKIEGRLLSIPVPLEPFVLIGMDFVGPLPVSDTGNSYILVITEYLSKFATAFPVASATASVAAQVLVEEWILRGHGVPFSVLSDRGTTFLCQVMAKVAELLGMRQRFTSAWHPQTNGLTERFNRTLCVSLRHYVDHKQRNWDLFIPYVLFAYNTTVHKSTRATPFSLVYGREARRPADWLTDRPFAERFRGVDDYRRVLVEGLELGREVARNLASKEQQKQKLAYDSRHASLSLKVGEWVWKKLHPLTVTTSSGRRAAKFMGKWDGPFKIARMVVPGTFYLSNSAGAEQGGPVSSRDLKRCHFAPELRNTPAQAVPEVDDEATESETDDMPGEQIPVRDLGERVEEQKEVKEEKKEMKEEKKAFDAGRARVRVSVRDGPGPIAETEDGKVYAVERLVARRPLYKKNEWEFLVLWKGWGRKDATWEKESDIDAETVQEWETHFPRTPWEYPRPTGKGRARQTVWDRRRM